MLRGKEVQVFHISIRVKMRNEINRSARLDYKKYLELQLQRLNFVLKVIVVI